jgi:hypothetical protein
MRVGAILCAFLAISAFSLKENIVYAQDHQPEQPEVSKNKEWSLLHPKAQDPDAFPGPDETSVNLAKLQEAKSLKEIYKLASKMNVNSVSDNRVLSKAVEDYLKNCCAQYDNALKELERAGFKNIDDSTESVLKRPHEYNMEGREFDKAVYSESRGNFKFTMPIPQRAVYKIHLFFNKNQLIRVGAYIFYDPVF